eukprot:1195862-Prorocentrum_minimum.AAC.5
MLKWVYLLIYCTHLIACKNKAALPNRHLRPRTNKRERDVVSRLVRTVVRPRSHHRMLAQVNCNTSTLLSREPSHRSAFPSFPTATCEDAGEFSESRELKRVQRIEQTQLKEPKFERIQRAYDVNDRGSTATRGAQE